MQHFLHLWLTSSKNPISLYTGFCRNAGGHSLCCQGAVSRKTDYSFWPIHFPVCSRRISRNFVCQPLLRRHLFPHDACGSHRLFGYDGRRLADQYLGRIQTPYQNAAGGNGVLWTAGNSDGFGKQLLCVFGADGRLRSCTDHGANSLYHPPAGEQYTGNVGTSIRIIRCSLFQFFAYRYGLIWSAGRQNIHAIVDGGIRRSADLDGSCDAF